MREVALVLAGADDPDPDPSGHEPAHALGACQSDIALVRDARSSRTPSPCVSDSDGS
jgi:hypothetical protein